MSPSYSPHPPPIIFGLKWPKLTTGTLLKRYKRFLADVKLRNGHTVTAHCANSGSMMGCSEPGCTVHLSRSDNKNRRLCYTWEMIEMPSSLVGVNTNVPNRLVAQALIDGQLDSPLRISIPSAGRCRAVHIPVWISSSSVRMVPDASLKSRIVPWFRTKWPTFPTQ